MKRKMRNLLLICLVAIGVSGLVGVAKAKTSPPVILVHTTTYTVTDLPPGTYQVAFEYMADEMVTFWHTNGTEFDWKDWDKFVWTPGSFTLTVDEPVTLYIEGYGCAYVCGKIRDLSITAVGVDEP